MSIDMYVGKERKKKKVSIDMWAKKERKKKTSTYGNAEHHFENALSTSAKFMMVAPRWELSSEERMVDSLSQINPVVAARARSPTRSDQMNMWLMSNG